MPTLYQFFSAIFGETVVLTTSAVVMPAFALMWVVKKVRIRRGRTLTKGTPS